MQAYDLVTEIIFEGPIKTIWKTNCIDWHMY